MVCGCRVFTEAVAVQKEQQTRRQKTWALCPVLAK